MNPERAVVTRRGLAGLLTSMTEISLSSHTYANEPFNAKDSAGDAVATEFKSEIDGLSRRIDWILAAGRVALWTAGNSERWPLTAARSPLGAVPSVVWP